MSKAPTEIYLQYDPDGETTWCEDKINGNDIAYVLKSRAEAEIKRLRGALKQLRSLKDKHYESEDCWYSCPKSGNCCNSEELDTECTCGKDKMDKIIDAALGGKK